MTTVIKGVAEDRKENKLLEIEKKLLEIMDGFSHSFEMVAD